MWLSWLIFAVSLALQVLVLNSLRRGSYKDYSLVFAYSLVLFFTTIADGAMWAKLIPLPKAARNLYFYRNEAVRQFMLFAVVISLIDHAISSTAYRVRVRAALALVSVISVLVSVQIHSSSSNLFSYWMTQVSRDLSFESERLTLPHPELRNRRFVVMPLAELAPDLDLSTGEPARVERVGRL